MEVEPALFVDFHDRPDGPARAHEVRLEGSDCTNRDLPVTSAPLAHMSGVPIEETLGSLGPALLAAFGAASTQLRARLRSDASPHRPRKKRARSAGRPA
jgi:hypothetical protein